MRMLKLILITIIMVFMSAESISAQNEIPAFLKNPVFRSSSSYEKKANTIGNRVNITFFNTGLLAGSGETRGEWPKGSKNDYIGDVSPVVAMEVPIDLNKDGVPDTLVKRVITNRGPRLGQSAKGSQKKPNQFYGFEPMYGFARPDSARPAISTDPSTWPGYWPDQPEWTSTSGSADWNGFFGRDIQNADFETYFWMDDNNDEYLNERYGFLPDSTDPTRLGQGLAIKVRGLQWSQFLAQDAVYWIYELTNTGTTTFSRVNVGLIVGTLAGGDGDSSDDAAFFDQANRIMYSWDIDNKGNRQQPVGYVGYAFMESPGDPYDGIDNDGDGNPSYIGIDGFPLVKAGLEGVGNVFEEIDFLPRVLKVDDPIILIDENTYERSIVYMTSDTLTVKSQGKSYLLQVGMTLKEKTVAVQGLNDIIIVTDKNLIDDDFDGIIDEDRNLHYQRRQQNFLGQIVTLPALRYKNYYDFALSVKGRVATLQDSIDHGLRNNMIDESSDDGIDNDGDWNALTDDVGADGKSGTGDFGEGDGKPTPGEPNFDALDVDETDQVGLSSFYYFNLQGQSLDISDNIAAWNAMTPGFFTTNAELETFNTQGIDGDFIFGSGYFRLKPGQTLRFSLALVFGENLANITNNVQTVQEIYNRNYNFAKPPDKPTLSAFASDKKVTLYWNDVSEFSVDPVLGKDFEGYKIYRSTDPFFLDPKRITDYGGNEAVLTPIAQFDLKNGIKGLWKPIQDTSSTTTPAYIVNADLIDRTRGVPFYLGADVGVQHSYVDTTVVNGQTYFYALVAYDRGSKDFYPAENNFAITVSEDGRIIKDINVVEVKPNAGVSGYVSGSLQGDILHAEGAATGGVFIEVLNPSLVQENSKYQIVFNDSGFAADTFSVKFNNQNILHQLPITSSEAYDFDGMRVRFNNDRVRLNSNNHTWVTQRDSMIKVTTREDTLSNTPTWYLTAVNIPADYQIEFYDQIVDTSTAGKVGTKVLAPNLTATPTYFRVKNLTSNSYVKFGFRERQPPLGSSSNAAPGEEKPEKYGRIDDNDQLFIYEDYNGSRVVSVYVAFDYNSKIVAGKIVYIPTGREPIAGEIFKIFRYKSFRDNDVYEFTTKSSNVDLPTAQEQLDRIKVVPNPYIAAASWERKLPPTITSGRGERRIDFIHVPKDSHIRIFNVRGDLVKELFHNGDINNGTVSWDLRTRENLEIAYGVYFYHVEAKGMGSKTGKLAIIK